MENIQITGKFVSVSAEREKNLKKYKRNTYIFNVIFVIFIVVGLFIMALGIQHPFFGDLSLNAVSSIKYITMVVGVGLYLLKWKFFNIPISEIKKRIFEECHHH